MLFEWIDADDKIKETVLAISDLLEKKNISISEFNTIKKLLTWVVYENTTCCKNKDSITDKGCDKNHMDNKNATENAVEFIWQAQITKDFYNSSSLKEIYDWLLNIAKSECDARIRSLWTSTNAVILRKCHFVYF